MRITSPAVLLLALALAPTLTLTGCKKGDDSAPPEATAAAGSGAGAEEDADDEDEEEEEESPYLDASNFNRKIEDNLPKILACYRDTAGKEADPPTGRVRATVIVDGQGAVKKVTFDDQRSDLKHDGLYACITETVKALTFNISLTGAETPMPYTFDLRKGELLPE